MIRRRDAQLREFYSSHLESNSFDFPGRLAHFINAAFCSTGAVCFKIEVTE